MASNKEYGKEAVRIKELEAKKEEAFNKIKEKNYEHYI